MKLLLFATVIAQLLLSCGWGWLYLSGNWARADARAQTCEYAFALNSYITKQTRKGEKSLDSFAYYRQHPDEKKKAIERSEAGLKDFIATTPPFCERT